MFVFILLCIKTKYIRAKKQTKLKLCKLTWEVVRYFRKEVAEETRKK